MNGNNVNSEVLFYGTYTLSTGVDSPCICICMRSHHTLYRNPPSSLSFLYNNWLLLSRMRRHKGSLEFSARPLAARFVFPSFRPLLRDSFWMVYALTDNGESFQRETLHRHEVQKWLSLFRTFSRPCQLDCPQSLDSDSLTKPLLITLM